MSAALTIARPTFRLPRFEPWRLLKPLRMDGQFFPRQGIQFSDGVFPANIGAGSPAISIHSNDGVLTACTGSNPYTASSKAIGTADSTRAVVARITWLGGGTAQTVSGVTIGGITATIVNQVNPLRSGFHSGTALAWAMVPTGTTASVVVTFSGTVNSCDVNTIAFIGPASPSVQDSGTASEQTSNITIQSTTVDKVAGGITIMGATGRQADNRSASASGYTEDFDSGTTETGGAVATSSAESGATIQVTWSAATERSGLCAATWR